MGGVIVLIVLLLVAAGILIWRIFVKLLDTFVREHSVRLMKAAQINEKYFFASYDDHNLWYAYDNKKMYDGISCRDFLI